MADERFVLNDLDTLATESYPRLVVRKDLLRRMRSAFGVPAFVIEFLLGKYCASTDEETIREGLEFVRETLAGKYVKPDEREAVKSAIKQHTSFEIIDKISVRLIETHDKYWARLSNLDLDYINLEESEVRRHDRLLMGGIWAEVTLRYDGAYIFKNQNRPFFIESIRPIQLSSRKLDDFIEGRRRFTRDQWLDLMMRSMGYEPEPSVLHQATQAALHAAAPAVRREKLQFRRTWPTRHRQELRVPTAQSLLPFGFRRAIHDSSDVRQPVFRSTWPGVYVGRGRV